MSHAMGIARYAVLPLTSSPYYVWACRMFSFFGSHSLDLVLDPRIGYTGLVADCEGDATSLRELEQAKDNLEQYFCSHYCTSASRPLTPLPSSPDTLLSAYDSPEKVDFTSRYETLPVESVDEWEEFLTLKHESFATCDPIQCWGGRSLRFPKLSKPACDILSMPGMSLFYYAVHFLT
jgi:hAT family C-terminal dimerisation region